MSVRKDRFGAVIFDMDGVLVDSEIHWIKVESEFLKQLIPSWGPADQERVLGLSVRDVYQLLRTSYQLELNFEDYIGHYRALAHDIYGIKSDLIPGIDILIQELKASFVPVGLASSSTTDWIRIVLERFSLKPHFNVVVSSDDLSGPSKPDPTIYRVAASKLGLGPERCIAIEDTDKGLASAAGAGMFCVGFRNGFNQQQNFRDADRQVQGHAELLLLMRELGVI